MSSAVIVSTARTPLAKSWKGSFNMTHGATRGGHAVEHAIQRAGIEAAEVDDVIMGYGFPVYRGGPMLYADQLGLFNVVQSMNRFAQNPLDDAKFWKPAPLLAKLAAEGKTFNQST